LLPVRAQRIWLPFVWAASRSASRCRASMSISPRRGAGFSYDQACPRDQSCRIVRTADDSIAGLEEGGCRTEMPFSRQEVPEEPQERAGNYDRHLHDDLWPPGPAGRDLSLSTAGAEPDFHRLRAFAQAA